MSLGARRRRPPTPRFVANELWRRAGAVPSFHIAPARTQNATDLITGSVLGTYNSASPAWAVGPDGVLFQPAANAPVIEHDPVTLACLGARIWGAVTNLSLRSEEIDNTGAWTSAGITAAANNAVAPNNQASAETISVTVTGPSTAFIYQIIPCSPSTVYTWSFYVKLGTLSAANFRFAIRDDSNNAFIAQDIIPSVALSTSTWQRVTYTFATPAGCVLVRPYIYRTSPSNVGTFFAWGAQLNTGPLAPYVPTTTTTASSTADVWSITGADFTRIFNNASGTIYAQAQNNTSQNFSGTFRHIAQATPATSIDSSVGVLINSSNQYQLQVRDNAVNQASFTTGTNSGDVSKVAAAYAASDFAISANGGSPGTQASGSAPTTTIISQIVIGGVRDGNPLGALNGYIRELAIFRSRRPNTNLQAMTS